MKAKIFSSIGAGLAALLIVTTVSATGSLPGSGWWSSQIVQNVASINANVTVQAFPSGGGSPYNTSSSSVGTGASLTVDPSGFSGMPSGFIGSAVVSSDQPVVAIGNITNRLKGSFGVSGGKANAFYQATVSPATTLYFPLAKHNRFGYTTLFYLQNAGTAAATASLTFTMDNGVSYPYVTPSIPPNQMVVVSPADAGVPSSPSNATRVNIGGLTVTSAQPLAGSYIEYQVGQAVGTIIFSTRAFTSADFDDKAFAPTIKRNRFGRFTGIQVQNVSGSPINVTVNYVGTAGPCLGGNYMDSTTNIAVGKSFTFNQFEGFTNLPDNCPASATITGTGNFVAQVNELNMAGSTPAALVYSAPAEATGTNKLAAPYFADRRTDGGVSFTSGMKIQNVGNSQANSVVATFRCTGAASFTAITQPFSIAAGSAVQFFQPGPGGFAGNPAFTVGNPFSSSNVVCSVIVTSDQPIHAIVNTQPDTVGAVDDANYESFPLIP